MKKKKTAMALSLILLGMLLIALPDLVFGAPLSLGIPLAVAGIFIAGEGFFILREIILPESRGRGKGEQEDKKRLFYSSLVTIKRP